MLKLKQLPDHILFAVCELFLAGEPVKKIVEWLGKNAKLEVKRETIYPMLREAKRRGYVILWPPAAYTAAKDVARHYRTPAESIRVVDVQGESALEHVATAAADETFTVIKELGRHKKTVHIGLGAGWTTMLVAGHLADRLRSEGAPAFLTLHALSSGFSVRAPHTSPVAFFSFFHDIPVGPAMKYDKNDPHMKYVGLFAPAFVDVADYERVKRIPGVKESFDLAREIDVVITSLAGASDDHGELKDFMQLGSKGHRDMRALSNAGWVGDVQYRPYSATQPILLNQGVRAVTLFELPDLARLAAAPDKHVILVAGPCSRCQQPKADALRPLLTEPALAVWSKLVMDVTTARELLLASPGDAHEMPAGLHLLRRSV